MFAKQNVLPKNHGYGRFNGRTTYRLDCDCGSDFCFSSAVFFVAEKTPKGIYRAIKGGNRCIKQQSEVELKRAQAIVRAHPELGIDEVTVEMLSKHRAALQAYDAATDRIESDYETKIRKVMSTAVEEIKRLIDKGREEVDAKLNDFIEQSPLGAIVEAGMADAKAKNGSDVTTPDIEQLPVMLVQVIVQADE